MELELGLKIAKTLDSTQSTDFRIAKDRTGPLFLSQETDTMFILTAHLRGYKQDDIKISINEDGTLIEIIGERVVQEMVMKGWLMFKKEPEVRSFKKKFKIPNGVILDQIEAKYNEEDSMLTIDMPKESKGITREGIKEVKENEEEEIQDDEGSKLDTNNNTTQKEEESKEREIKEEEQKDAGHGEGSEMVDDYDQVQGKDVAKKSSKFFAPCLLMGSAIVASLVVLVFGFVRPKKKES